MDKKTIIKILKILIPITIAYIIIITNVHFTWYDKDLYLEEFEKHGTYDRLEDPEYLLDNIHEFFRHKEELDPGYFNEREINHMLDVRVFVDRLNLILTIFIIADIIAFIVLWHLKLKINDLLKILRNGSYAAIICFIIIILLGLNFSWLFISFHEVFFESGTYSFPVDSTLIKLFPFGFWQDMFISIAINCFLTALALLLFAIIMNLIYKKQTA